MIEPVRKIQENSNFMYNMKQNSYQTNCKRFNQDENSDFKDILNMKLNDLGTKAKTSKQLNTAQKKTSSKELVMNSIGYLLLQAILFFDLWLFFIK